MRSCRVVDFGQRTSPFRWNGRRRGLRDGWYSLRLRARRGGLIQDRLVGLRRSRARWRVLPGYHRPTPCAPVTYFSLSRPIFGGRASRKMPITFRLRTRARVAVTVRRGRKRVKTFTVRRYSGRRDHRLRLASSRLPAGWYRVDLRATAAGVTTRRSGRALKLPARRPAQARTAARLRGTLSEGL